MIHRSSSTIHRQKKSYEPSDINHKPPEFPALVLLVSGGHTEIILMKDHGEFQLLGSTLDDAAGECFDKCGRVLGLSYPYGPYIEQEADKFIANSSWSVEKLPRPLINTRNFDFSFSGLKTAFLREYKRLNSLNINKINIKPLLAHELQESVTDILVTKTLNAAENFHPKSLLICGGVAANKRLREKFKMKIENFASKDLRQANKLKIALYIPPIKLCTDNAAYIASAAYFNQNLDNFINIDANPGLTISP